MKLPNIFFLVILSISLLWLEAFAEEQGTCSANDESCQNNAAQPSSASHAAKIAKGSNEKGAPPQASLRDCKDRYEVCKDYAARGECQKNPGWMTVSCAKSCDHCHLLDPKVRCNRKHLNVSDEPIYHPGDMEHMFREIIPRFSHVYDIEIFSESPWIVVFHNFLTDEETDAFVQTVEGTWERSTDSGSTNELGETGRLISQSRTSSNAWCRHNCESDPRVQSVIHKIEEVTNIPYSHYESFQILRYEPGQYYRVHHDMGLRQVELSCGPRILTFFLYLSDVEDGGETHFPQVGAKVKPRRGSAVLWPSTYDHNPLQQDPRTHHEAMAVKTGLKYAANSWIHLYDFQQSNLWGCTGAFDYL